MGRSAASSPRLLLILSLALIAGLNALAYLPGRHGPFVFDDWINIVQNSDVQSAGAGQTSLLSLARPRLHPRRPLAELSFALNLRGFGPDPFSFHLVNLGIHILTAWLLWTLILEMLKRREGPRLEARSYYLAALAGTLLWSLQPVHTQAVTYLVQRMTSLATLFYLLAFFLWLQARKPFRRMLKTAFGALALLAATLGFLAKEIMLTLPMILLVAELCFLGKDRPFWKRRFFLLAAVLIGIGYGVLFLALGPTLAPERALNLSGPSWEAASRIWSQPRIIGHYISLLAFPHLSRISLDPEWTNSTGILSPWTTAPALLALAGWLGISLFWIRRRPLAAFISLFFLIILLPESLWWSLIPLDPIFDHRLYLPSTALLAAAGAGLAWPGRWQRQRLSLLGFSLLLLLLLTAARNRTFSDDLRLFKDTVKKSPEKARVWTNLAAACQSRNLSAATLHASLQAVRLKPASSQFSLNLSRIYLASGKIPLARQAAEQAHALKPDDPSPLRVLGLVEKAAGNPEQALAWFGRAREISPEDPETLEQLGNLYLELDRPEEARAVLVELLRRYPNLVGVYFQMGNSYVDQGRWSEAAEAFAQELRLFPNSPEAANNLGMAWLKLDRPDRALPALERAVEMVPEDGIFQVNLCDAQLHLGRLDLAEGACRRALALEPSLGLGWQKLGEIFLRAGRRGEAIQALENAGRLIPQDQEVLEMLEQARTRSPR